LYVSLLPLFAHLTINYTHIYPSLHDAAWLHTFGDPVHHVSAFCCVRTASHIGAKEHAICSEIMGTPAS
jgi:hypothetical protein